MNDEGPETREWDRFVRMNEQSFNNVITKNWRKHHDVMNKQEQEAKQNNIRL